MKLSNLCGLVYEANQDFKRLVSEREEGGWYWSWEGWPSSSSGSWEKDPTWHKSAFVFPETIWPKGTALECPDLCDLQSVWQSHFWVSVFLRIRMPSGSLRSQTRSNFAGKGWQKVGKVSQSIFLNAEQKTNIFRVLGHNWKPKKMFICTPWKSTERWREAYILGDTWVPELILEQHVLESL